MSLSFLHIGWLNAVVGEARLKKPTHKTPTTALKKMIFFLESIWYWLKIRLSISFN